MWKIIDLPPVWLVGFAALAWLQSDYLPIGQFGAWADWVGAILVLAGIGLAIAAAIAFRRHKTTIIPHQQPSAIVTTGVYAFSRNPIYLGDAMILLGLVLFWDAVPSLGLIPLFVLLLERRFIAGEEARLEAQFPDEFAAYRGVTRRWL